MKELSLPTVDIIFSSLLICLPLLLGIVHFNFTKGKKFELILLYYIVIGIGIQGLASGVMQTFFSDSVIQYVHWPYSPFILELGLANISYGILGILSPWMNRGWQTATAFGYALFLLFTGMRHTLEIAERGLNAGDSGAFFYVDIIMSCLLFSLLALRYRESAIKKAFPDVVHPTSNQVSKLFFTHKINEQELE